MNSRLDQNKLVGYGFKPLPTWQDAVRKYLEEAELIEVKSFILRRRICEI